MSFDQDRYQVAIHTRILGRSPVHFSEIDSTSAYLKRLVRSGASDLSDGMLVLADSQTAGYGQQGRTWVSIEAEGFYCSLYHPIQAPTRPFSFMAGLAAIDAIRAIVPNHEVGLKWVNDVVARGRKLGGILAEIISRPGGGQALVLGIGLNLSTPDLPEAISLSELGARPEREILLAHLMNTLENWFARPDEDVYSQWSLNSVTLGQRVRVQLPSETLEGRALELTSNGALKLQLDEGSFREVISGSLRLADGRYC